MRLLEILGPVRSYVPVVAGAWTVACGGVRIADLSAPRPVPAGSCVVVGLLGGLDNWDEPDKGVRKLALSLRDPDRRLYAETFENRRVGIARQFVVLTLDADRDGVVSETEGARARIVVYGQSLGGMAAARLARLLEREGVPIELLVLIDSVGWADQDIPSNVRRAANLYQDDGLVIRGQHPIRPADPDATRIVGQWEFEYDEPPGSTIRVEDLPWHKLAFRVAHARMDRDPRVWQKVDDVIRSACAERRLTETDATLP
jgi:pimeloyl-ACP methyl ester carboxylesterase